MRKQRDELNAEQAERVAEMTAAVEQQLGRSLTVLEKMQVATCTLTRFNKRLNVIPTEGRPDDSPVAQAIQKVKDETHGTNDDASAGKVQTKSPD